MFTKKVEKKEKRKVSGGMWAGYKSSITEVEKQCISVDHLEIDLHKIYKQLRGKKCMRRMFRYKNIH